jgi:glycosyltransferase involved in cell wall biosynthesis
MKVGFVINASSDSGWLGERNYLRNLFLAMAAMKEPKIEPLAFTTTYDAKLPFALDTKAVHTPIVRPKSPQWLIRYGVRTISSRDWVFEYLLRRYGIEVLSHAQHLGRGASVAAVGWIPDFQHIHLPRFFSEKERTRRDAHFKRLCEHCDNIIVSSNCAKSDLESFLPQYSHKAKVLQFVSTPEMSRGHSSLNELQDRYSFSGPYFILPNQFWAHKNHRTVISALRLLKLQKKRVLVLSTGRTEDGRNPEYFPAVLSFAKECNVQDSLLILGVIPYEDLSGLMRHAVAFINPSQFEGWSTSVEESKSLGKRILLSDIPVHREQCPPLGTYFDPNAPEDLALKMRQCYEEYDPDKDLEDRQTASTNLLFRQQQFAESYQDIVLTAALSHSEKRRQ